VSAQPAEQLARYPSGTLANLVAERPHGKTVPLESLSVEIQRGTFALAAAPGDIMYEGVRVRRIQTQRRIVATYLGRQRVTGRDRRKAIDYWGGLAASKENYSQVYATELAFSEDGKTYWLPVNLLAMGDRATPSFTSGERYVLFVHSVAWLGAVPVLVVLFGAPESDFSLHE